MTFQKQEFQEWLANCPVQWFCHDGMTSDSSQDTAVYEFVFDDEDDDERGQDSAFMDDNFGG